MNYYKLGSLFDGSGGFPLAGALCGIEPVWASEIEPYPIAVTRERFPNMKHLGDISKINGAEVEPVDVITFGSPCQDLSVAGKRAGLKHEANGDEETTRSGLFMEAVRIIKEMRKATNGKYPRFALWENVPGAFSSNKGEDFRVVCEELIKIVEPSASMPPVPQNGWNYSDSYRGDGWSLGYRVLDAQYWGVPQRRRRIYLVADFRGTSAHEVLFEREGLRGYFAEGRTPWQTTPAAAESCSGADDRKGEGFDGYNTALTGDKSATLGINCGVSTGRNGVIEIAKNAVVYALDQQGGKGGANFAENVMPTICSDSHGTPHAVAVPYTLKIRSGCDGGGKGALIQKDKSATLATNNDQYLFQPVAFAANQRDEVRDLGGKASALQAQPGMKQQTFIIDSISIHNQNPSKDQGGIALVEPVFCLQGNGIDRADTAGCNGKGWREDASYTLNTLDRPAVAYMTSCTTHGGEPAVAYLGSGKKTAGTLMASMATKQCLGDQEAFSGDYHIVEETLPHANYIVRRLTPTECARLQGFADWWGVVEQKEALTEEELRFWVEVRNTHAAINGKKGQEYTEKQMLTWYNKLWTDSSEYKMWGNGIALPTALYCVQGIAEALNTITEEVTDLSDAPKEIKEEIMKNAEQLKTREANELEIDRFEPYLPRPAASEQTLTTIHDFNAAEQLKRLAEERKTLASINPENDRFANDIRAIEYAISVLEAVGL